MKTTNTKKTNHTQEVQEKYASNQQWIQKKTGISEDELFMFKTEIGCRLLEEIYPRHGEYEVHYQKHSKNPDYWKWFRLVWAKWDANFILYKESFLLTASDYKSDMEQIVMDNGVHDNYSNTYLKLMFDGR